MQNPTFSVGDFIEAHCTKCRKNTQHSITTLDEEIPAKVQCQSCERQHKYRPPKTVKKPAKSRTLHNLENERQEWEALRTDLNSEKASEYSMAATYKVGALIKHPVFGLGYVQRITGLRKIEVLFEGGKKTMRCK